MKAEKELLELLKDSDLDNYKLNTVIIESNTLELMSIEDLIYFSNKHKIDTIFYFYSFIDEDFLSIDDETISNLKFDEDVLLVLQNKFDEYNENLSRLDFSKPVSLNVYCIYQGAILSAQEDDYWFLEQGFGMPENTCLKLANEYSEDIVAEKKKTEQKIINGREELRKQILNDDEFRKCTNIQLRRIYAEKIFGNKGTYPYQWLFTDKRGLIDITITSFVEGIWKEYKDSLTK